MKDTERAKLKNQESCFCMFLYVFVAILMTIVTGPD